MKFVVKNLSTKKTPGYGGFSGEFYQLFKEEIMPILSKLFSKVENKGTLVNSFCEASITFNQNQKMML